MIYRFGHFPYLHGYHPAPGHSPHFTAVDRTGHIADQGFLSGECHRGIRNDDAGQRHRGRNVSGFRNLFYHRGCLSDFDDFTLPGGEFDGKTNAGPCVNIRRTDLPYYVFHERG